MLLASLEPKNTSQVQLGYLQYFLFCQEFSWIQCLFTKKKFLAQETPRLLDHSPSYIWDKYIAV